MSVLAVSALSAVLLVGQIHADFTIMGAVADGNGEPVAQAEIVFTAGPALDGAVPILERATTDASGRFRLIRPSAEALRGFAAAGSVWVYKPGLGLALADLVRGDRPGQVHRLVLEPANARKLIVRDAAGKPVSGARVAPRIVETELTGFMGIAIPDLWIDRFAATKDADGVVLVACLSRRTDLRSVYTTIAGAGRQVLQLPYEQGKDDTTLVLGRPARLSGEIKSATGAPAAGVSVRESGPGGVPIGKDRSLYLTPEIVRFEPGPIRTGAHGLFQTPPALWTGRTYRVVVR